MHFYKLLGILLKENYLLHVVYLSRCIPLARDQKGLQRVSKNYIISSKTLHLAIRVYAY